MAFYGIEIWDDTHNYYTELDNKHDIQYNIGESQVQEVFTKAKPYFTTFGDAQYFSGSCTGLFIDNTDGECIHDYSTDSESTTYLFEVMKFLGNKKKKYLQLSDEFVITIMVKTPIKCSPEKGLQANSSSVSFDWVQVGEGDDI